MAKHIQIEQSTALTERNSSALRIIDLHTHNTGRGNQRGPFADLSERISMHADEGTFSYFAHEDTVRMTPEEAAQVASHLMVWAAKMLAPSTESEGTA